MSSTSAGRDAVEIDLVDVLKGIWRRKLFIAVVGLIFAFAAAGFVLTSPISVTGSRLLTVDHPFPVGARDGCGFAANAATQVCGSEYVARDLATEIALMEPPVGVQVRNVAEGGVLGLTRDFQLTAASSYSPFSSGGEAAARNLVESALSQDYVIALEAIRNRYINDAAGYVRVLAGPEFSGARNADTFVTYLVAAKMSQRQLENGLPRLVAANDVVITERFSMGDPIPNAIQWGIVGLLLGAVVAGVREIFAQVAGRNPA